MQRRLSIIVLLMGTLLTVLPAQPASAHCTGTRFNENLSGFNGAGGRPHGPDFETYGRNMNKLSNCYNDNYHYVWYWRNGQWNLAADDFCAVWRAGDNASNQFTIYQCWLYWRVTPGWWWSSTADFYTVSNHWAGGIWEGGFGADHNWDYDWASASDCWFYHGGVLWTRGCV